MNSNLHRYIEYVDLDLASVEEPADYLSREDLASLEYSEDAKDVLLERIREVRRILGMNLRLFLYATVYRPSWSKGGVWYYDVWASDGKMEQKIRGGEMPYTTKRETMQKAEEQLRELSVYYQIKQKGVQSNGKNSKNR